MLTRKGEIIQGADTFARGLVAAEYILTKTPYAKMLKERYESYDKGQGEAFENAKLEQRKHETPVVQQPVQLADGGNLPPQPTTQDLPAPDPRAEEWAGRNQDNL